MSTSIYTYIVLANAEVAGFNAMANPYVIGAPGPTALVGWGHALERMLRGLDRRFAGPGPYLHVAGAALLVHTVDLDEGRPLFPAQFDEPGDRDVANKGGTPSMVEEIKGHGRCSLVAAIGTDADTDPDDAEDAHDWLHAHPRAIADWAVAAGLAGGAVHGVGAAEVFARLVGTDTRGGLLARLAGLGGTALTDRGDLLEPDDAGDERDRLDRLLDTLAVVNEAPSEGDTSPTRYRRQPGWLVPYAAGFKALETPKARRNAVNGQPHVYAEPLLGLGEYLPVSRLIAGGGERLLDAFWCPNAGAGVYAARPMTATD